MPIIKVLPHAKYCPQGAEFPLETGANLLQGMLRNGVKLEHACEGSCACATCHVYVREGFDSLEEPSDREHDCLDRAWGSGAASRLACQVRVAGSDLTVEIPRYSRNQVSEDD